MSKRFCVDVVVDTSREKLQDRIETYVKRELRSLGDVDIYGENDAWSPIDYTLSIGPLKLEDTIYINVNYHVPIATVEDRLKEHILIDDELKRREFYKKLFSGGYGVILSGAHYAFPVSKLRKYCEELVTDFDEDILEAPRRGKTPAEWQFEKWRREK